MYHACKTYMADGVFKNTSVWSGLPFRHILRFLQLPRPANVQEFVKNTPKKAHTQENVDSLVLHVGPLGEGLPASRLAVHESFVDEARPRLHDGRGQQVGQTIRNGRHDGQPRPLLGAARPLLGAPFQLQHQRRADGLQGRVLQLEAHSCPLGEGNKDTCS